MTHDERYEIAVRLLKPKNVKKLERDIIDEDTLYVYENTKGGAALLIDREGEVLYADSSISPEEHLQAFHLGTRTPKEDFEKLDV